MDENLVKKWVDEAISENKFLFLIELSFLTGNKIKIIVDGDQGVPIKECVRISRYIEHNLGEDEIFSLEVTSPDITKPLSVTRQYQKNINRILKVKTEEGQLEGKLVDVDEKGISLTWKTRESKIIGKGKITIQKNAQIAYTDIKEAKVKITF